MAAGVSSGHATFSLFIFINFLSLFADPTSFSIYFYENITENVLYEGDAMMISGSVEFNPQFYMYRVSRCSYSKPFHLWDPTTPARSLSSFDTNFTFWIDTGNENHSADGFAFFLAPFGYPIPPNSAGGDLGLFNSTTHFEKFQNRVVHVEFDTFSDSWDPRGSHVGININSISSTVNATWDFNVNRTKEAIYARVTYNASDYMLTVFWTYNEDRNWGYDNSLSFKIDLREVLPEEVVIGFSATTSRYAENFVLSEWLFTSDLDYDDISRKGEKNSNKHAVFLIAAMTAVTFFILMLGVALFRSAMKKRISKIKGQKKVQVPSVSKHLETVAFPRRFSYKELFSATFGFANDRRLGRGGSGQVYKGVLQDLGCLVAVKRIFADSEQYEKVFINEVKIISRLIHKNLVMFIGWCHEQGECLLVYAHMPNGSLDAHLFGPKTTLQWDVRYKIALGLASALHYLHEEAEQCILHRDIKSANVLLDNDFNTKLGDFGIAKLLDPHLRTRTTGVAGTFGYMAPEYAFQGRASKESDMFSFGVVALEIACGRQTYQDGEYHVPLSEWIWQKYLAGNLLDVADERLNMKFDPSEMKCLLIVGLWCTHPSNKERPKAGQVMKVLQLEAPLPQLAGNRHHDHHQYNDYVLPDQEKIL